MITFAACQNTLADRDSLPALSSWLLRRVIDHPSGEVGLGHSVSWVAVRSFSTLRAGWRIVYAASSLMVPLLRDG